MSRRPRSIAVIDVRDPDVAAQQIARALGGRVFAAQFVRDVLEALYPSSEVDG